MKTVKLSNNKIVGNFSSPHSFTFTDGSVLEAVSNEEAERLKVNFIESVDEPTGDVELVFALPLSIWDRMKEWEKLYLKGEVHVVFCPLPMIIELKECGFPLKKSPFRTVKIENRIQKLVSIDKQCL